MTNQRKRGQDAVGGISSDGFMPSPPLFFFLQWMGRTWHVNRHTQTAMPSYLPMSVCTFPVDWICMDDCLDFDWTLKPSGWLVPAEWSIS